MVFAYPAQPPVENTVGHYTLLRQAFCNILKHLAAVLNTLCGTRQTVRITIDPRAYHGLCYLRMKLQCKAVTMNKPLVLNTVPFKQRHRPLRQGKGIPRTGMPESKPASISASSAVIHGKLSFTLTGAPRNTSPDMLLVVIGRDSPRSTASLW